MPAAAATSSPAPKTDRAVKAKLARHRHPQHHAGDAHHDAANQAGFSGRDMGARRAHGAPAAVKIAAHPAGVIAIEDMLQQAALRSEVPKNQSATG